MSWFKEITSKAEAILVKLDQNAAQALQNPTSIVSDVSTYTISETNAIEDTKELPDHNNLNDLGLLSETVIHATNQHEPSRDKVPGGTLPTPSNLIVSNSSNWSSEGPTSSKRSSQVIPSDIRLETPNSNQVKRRIQIEGPVEDGASQNADNDIIRSARLSKKFTIPTSRTKSNLFSEINTIERKGPTTLEKEKSERNSHPGSIPSLAADDIRASINQTLNEYNTTYSTSHMCNHLDHLQKNSNHNHTSHFDDHPFIVREGELNSTSERRNSALSCSIDFPDDNGSNTDITARLLHQNISKRKSAFNVQRVINKLANTNASDYMVFSDHKRVKLRRFKLRLATYVRRLSYYFQTYPNMKYYAIGYVVLMQLLVVYVLFFHQTTPTPSDLSIQIDKQLKDVHGIDVT